MPPIDPATERLSLLQDEVHLFWGRGEEGDSLEAARAWLSDEERERGERFRREADARAFVRRRVFLRSILAGFAGCGPGELAFADGARGKPRLSGPLRPGLELTFNLSRSGPWMLLGVARGRELGVDVEGAGRIGLDAEEVSRLAQRVLSAAERQALEALPPAERREAFLRAWTRKEAVLKARGTGLAIEPDTIAVGVEALEPLLPRPLDAACLPLVRGGALVDLLAPPGLAAALVAEGTDWSLVVHARATRRAFEPRWTAPRDPAA